MTTCDELSDSCSVSVHTRKRVTEVTGQEDEEGTTEE